MPRRSTTRLPRIDDATAVERSTGPCLMAVTCTRSTTIVVSAHLRLGALRRHGTVPRPEKDREDQQRNEVSVDRHRAVGYFFSGFAMQSNAFPAKAAILIYEERVVSGCGGALPVRCQLSACRPRVRSWVLLRRSVVRTVAAVGCGVPVVTVGCVVGCRRPRPPPLSLVRSRRRRPARRSAHRRPARPPSGCRVSP